MASHESLLLVRMLRYQGRLSDSELQLVLQLAERCADHGELLDTLRARGLVGDDWAERIEGYVRHRARAKSQQNDELGKLDRSFGQIALERGWIGLTDLEDALLEQERLRRKHLYFRLGEILVTAEILSIEQVREILEEQGVAHFRCDHCDLVIRGVGSEDRMDCPSCGGDLVSSEFLEIVRADLPQTIG